MSGDSPVRMLAVAPALAVAAALALAAALAVVLAGCGGGHRATSSTTATAGPAAPTTTPAPPATTTTGTAGATAPTGGPYWPYAKLLASLDGRTVVLTRSTVRLDSGLLECNGEGSSVATGSARGWRRYTCTQTVFQAGADHDVTFDVATVSATQLKITSPRYGPD